MDPSSGVKARGTFEGIREKIPYLKELGVNAVELMPIFEFDEMDSAREHDGKKLLDYWGYNTVCFFAPNTSYSYVQEHNHEGDELKRLIRELHGALHLQHACHTLSAGQRACEKNDHIGKLHQLHQNL